MEALARALIECDYSLVEVLAGSLEAVTADSQRYVREYFLEGDVELRRLALDALEEQRAKLSHEGIQVDGPATGST